MGTRRGTATRRRGSSSRRSCLSASRFMRGSSGGLKRKKPQPENAGWGFLNEVDGLTREGDRQASKLLEKVDRSRLSWKRWEVQPWEKRGAQPGRGSPGERVIVLAGGWG